MERKFRSLHQTACLRTKRVQMLYCIQSIHPGGDHGICQRLAARLQKSFPDRGNSPFGEINDARRTARSVLPKLLPCCLSARRFDTQRPSFLLPLLRFSVSVYGRIRLFQAVWHESPVSVTKSRFLLQGQNRALCYNQDERVYKGGWKL